MIVTTCVKRPGRCPAGARCDADTPCLDRQSPADEIARAAARSGYRGILELDHRHAAGHHDDDP